MADVLEPSSSGSCDMHWIEGYCVSVGMPKVAEGSVPCPGRFGGIEVDLW